MVNYVSTVRVGRRAIFAFELTTVGGADGVVEVGHCWGGERDEIEGGGWFISGLWIRRPPGTPQPRDPRDEVDQPRITAALGGRLDRSSRDCICGSSSTIFDRRLLMPASENYNLPLPSLRYTAAQRICAQKL